MEQLSFSGKQIADQRDQQVTQFGVNKVIGKKLTNTSMTTDEQCGKRVKWMTARPKVGETVDGPTTTTLGATTVTGTFLPLPPELLPIVLKNVSTENLITLRRVNSNWRCVTSQILVSRRSLQLSFATQRFMNCERIPVHPPLTRGISDLQLLNKCLKASMKTWGCLDQFPCVSFNFFDGKLGTQNMESFFKLIGPHIKILYLQSCNGRVEYDGGSMLARRLSQLISIEDLTLYKFRFLPPIYDRYFEMDNFKFQLNNNSEGQGTKLFSSLKELNCGRVYVSEYFTDTDSSDQIISEIKKVVPVPGVVVTNLAPK